MIGVWRDRAAVAAVLLLPVFLMYGRAVADMLIGVIDALFVLHCLLQRNWGWLRRPWVIVAGFWWAWLVICSLPGIGAGGMASLAQAIVLVRFLLLAAALEFLVLRSGETRIWLGRVITACAVWIGLNGLLQFAIGRNLAGFPRWTDGELTGPFQKPRAAAPLSRLIFPTMLPPAGLLLARGGWAARMGAAGLGVLAIATMVLMGQRMPLLLTLFGLCVSGLMLRRLRGVVAVALLAAVVLVGASAVVSPPSFYRLVTKFSAQMENFGASPYGLLAGRALEMAELSPWTGRGAMGFRTGCDDPATFHGFDWQGEHAVDGGGGDACNIHPHNHYLEALTDAGVPGLVLFSALVVLWLTALARGLGPDPDPLRVGLFVAALIQEWPLSSTSSFSAMDSGGWFFLLLGWGLAEARYRSA